MNLREFLAVEVMGWSKPYQKNNHSSNPWFYADDMPVNHWRPDELIEQAIMCARKQGGGWAIVEYLAGGCHGMVDMDNIGNYRGRADAKEPAAALSLAVAKAARWKDE